MFNHISAYDHIKECWFNYFLDVQCFNISNNHPIAIMLCYRTGLAIYFYSCYSVPVLFEYFT